MSSEQGKALAAEYNIHFFETSAKADINVQEAFTQLVKQVTDRIFTDTAGSGAAGQTKQGRNAVSLSEESGEKKGCCK